MSSSPSNMEELIDASPSPQHRCMKFTGRLQSLWPLACQDKTGSHSPVLCPPEIISPEVYPIGQPLFTNASLHRMLKHRISSSSLQRDPYSKSQHRTGNILPGAGFCASLLSLLEVGLSEPCCLSAAALPGFFRAFRPGLHQSALIGCPFPFLVHI